MNELGHDPLAVETVIITHLHQDHYLGLAPFLFYCGLTKRDQVRETPLTIIGPASGLETIVDAAKAFLQIERFPELATCCRLVKLKPGEVYEDGVFELGTCATDHVSGAGGDAEGLAFRFSDHRSGASVVFTGDTSCHPPIADFAQGADVLIHDAAHSTAQEAAMIARAAQVGRLLLIHYRKKDGEQLLCDAREVFAKTGLAIERETIAVVPGQLHEP